MADDYADKAAGAIDSVKNMVKDVDASWLVKTLVVLIVVVIFLKVYRRIRRFIIRRRPAKLHIKLQPYGEGSIALPEHATIRRGQAAKIVATSSGPTILGYELLEQVEAVFVDGFRRPEDAVEGLKAAAAMKGANAVINLQTESQGNRYAARGDAVIARRPTDQSPDDAFPDAPAEQDGAGPGEP